MKQLVFFLMLFLSLNTFSQTVSKSWKDINYAGDKMGYHNLDIYLPETGKPEYPAVVVIYGSAWLSNNLKGNVIETIGKPLLDAGFAVIAPNHRSSSDAKFPAQINDIKAAVRFIRANAAEYKIDTSFIAVTGYSSGGHLAALAGTSGKNGLFKVGTESADLEGKVGKYTRFSNSVDAVVDWFGPTDFLMMDSCGSSMEHNAAGSPESALVGGAIQENKDKVALANPCTYIDKTDPPFLILHGDKDSLVPHCQSELLHQKLRENGVKSALVIVPGAEHGPGLFEEKYYKMMTDFFASEMKKKNGNFHTGNYRNLFLEAGYSQVEIDKKLAKAYTDLFEGPNKIYFEVGDSMGYVSDIKNKDARTEGMSYGMMVAVQLDKKEVFDRIWRFSKKYLQHQSGPREAYFAWSFNPATMKQNSPGSASDGELYYITSLLFAANRWGNETGIDYYAEARRILDAMWKKNGTGNIYNLINVEHKQITFVPEGRNYNWTDPSYHLPAFYEIWAEYANDGHEQFYRDCADTSRVFLHRACHPVTGLNYDYANFDGTAHSTPWMPAAFRYDSWRVPMNIAQDYVWYGKDKNWQEDYAVRLQGFLRSKGIDTFEDQFNPDGTTPDFILGAGGFKKLRHSLGLKSTAATASLIGNDKKSLDFVHALWNAKFEPYEDGYFDPYYDGLLYLFSLMHLSGKYQIITPQNN